MRELEEPPSYGAVEWDPRRAGEQLVGVSSPQPGKLQPGHVAERLSELTLACGAQEGDVQVRHVTRHERDRSTRWLVDPLEVVDDCKHGPAQCERREYTEGRDSDGETVDENVSLLEPERTPESPGLRLGKRIDLLVRRSEELGEHGER